jgi:MFS family permease
MCLVGLIVALAIRPDPRSVALELEREGLATGAAMSSAAAEPLGRILRRPGVPAAVVAAVASLAVMASVMNLTGYIVVGHHHEQADVFTVISLHIVGMFGLVLVVGQLVDRVGRHRALIGGLIVMATSTVLLAWVVGIPSTALSLFLLGLGWNVSYVAASAELVTHARPVERGRLVGFTDTIAGLAAAALALLGGLAYTQWGVVAIAVGATVGVLAPALYLSLARRPPAVAPEPVG